MDAKVVAACLQMQIRTDRLPDVYTRPAVWDWSSNSLSAIRALAVSQLHGAVLQFRVSEQGHKKLYSQRTFGQHKTVSAQRGQLEQLAAR